MTEARIKPELLALQPLLSGAYPPERYRVGIPRIAAYEDNQQQVVRKGASTNLAEQFVVDVTDQQGAVESVSFFAKTLEAKNQDASFRALVTEVQAIQLFRDNGKGYATYEILGTSAGLSDRSQRRDSQAILLTRTITGLSALDGEIKYDVPIEDQDPWEEVTSSVGTLDRSALEGVLSLLHFMHTHGLFHKDAQPKNFGRVTSEAITANDEFNGIKAIDFEQGRFVEPAPNSKEKRLTPADEIQAALDDILTFYTYINLADSLGGDDQRMAFLDKIEATYSAFVLEKGGNQQAFRARLDQMLYT